MAKTAVVLLVDDDRWLVEQFMHNLAAERKYRVIQANNGIEAIDRIDDEKPDVIVLDLFMPGPNGLVLLHELQSYSDLARIPVVLCTNSAKDISLSENSLASYGIRAILDKSTMTPADLVRTVKGALA